MLVNNSSIKHLGFSGHSLGGSITQAQVVYFDAIRDKEFKLSISRNFEPFGIGKILTNLTNENMEIIEKEKEEIKNVPMFTSPRRMDYLGLKASSIARSTTTVNRALRNGYSGLPINYRDKIVNYYRVGDAVAEQEVDEMLGRIIKIETNYSSLKEFIKNSSKGIDVALTQALYGVKGVATDKFYNLHTMTNYRYQGYQEQNGSLFTDDANDANVKLLMSSSDETTKTRYNLVFNAMKNYEKI